MKCFHIDLFSGSHGMPGDDHDDHFQAGSSEIQKHTQKRKYYRRSSYNSEQTSGWHEVTFQSQIAHRMMMHLHFNHPF